jgi:nicotinamidase-related amidase
MFLGATEWHNPWLARVLPQIGLLVAHQPERSVFTRFIPLQNKDEGVGTWREYYSRWESMTLDVLGTEAIEIVGDLAHFIPPAIIIDKRCYSPWLTPDLQHHLKQGHIDTLIVSGGETDVCVLASVLGAVDRGYRVVLASDALCSTCDETHDKAIDLYAQRFASQVDVAAVGEILSMLPKT